MNEIEQAWDKMDDDNVAVGTEPLSEYMEGLFSDERNAEVKAVNEELDPLEEHLERVTKEIIGFIKEQPDNDKRTINQLTD